MENSGQVQATQRNSELLSFSHETVSDLLNGDLCFYSRILASAVFLSLCLLKIPFGLQHLIPWNCIAPIYFFTLVPSPIFLIDSKMWTPSGS